MKKHREHKVSYWGQLSNECRSKNRLDEGYINPNKWKIRGWNRRKKKVRQWGLSIQKPFLSYWDADRTYDHNDFGSYPYTYERYTMYPWYSFYKHRQPPLWFLKEIIKQFVNAFDHWNRLFKERIAPYDLFIRIVDPHYILSELRCVKMDNAGDRYYYWPPAIKQKPFPFEKFGSIDCDLSGFDWELRVEIDYVNDDFEYNGKNDAMLLRNGYDKEERADGILYTKAVGDVWIGRIR